MVRGKITLPEKAGEDGVGRTDTYHDPNFPKNEDGSIDLWNLNNLFTGAVKSSYIDSYLDRGLNAFEFVEGMKKELSGSSGQNWFTF